MEKFEEHYDRLYKEGEPFGETPDRLTSLIPKYKKEGVVLDAGAGYGRSALFLAKQGFDVRAIDISNEGIEKLKKRAEKENIKLTAEVSDIRNLDRNLHFDIAIVNFVLHHLKDDEARVFIERLKEQTNENGLHAISAFTKNGDFYRNKKELSQKFYPDPGELKTLYKNWQIVEWSEEITKSSVKKDGKPMENLTSFLITRKVVAK